MERNSILIIEDDININNMVKEVLIKEGYDIGQAFDGHEGIIKFEEKNYDLILLDVMMPIIDGLETMRRIRTKSNVPIIILSAKGEETDRIIGLGMGADDYLTKPFSVPELVARIKCNIRRCIHYTQEKEVQDKSIYKYGNVTFDMKNYCVYKGGEEVALTAKEMSILKKWPMKTI